MRVYDRVLERERVTCRAEEAISRLGLQSFFPRQRCRAVRRGKRFWKISPLFPHYAFVPKTDGWQSAHQDEFGVLGFAMDGDMPGIVPQSSMDLIYSRLDRAGFVDMRPSERFAMRQRVRVGHGSLSDMIGRYGGLARPGRAVVDYTMFGRQVPSEVNEADLVAA